MSLLHTILGMYMHIKIKRYNRNEFMWHSSPRINGKNLCQVKYFSSESLISLGTSESPYWHFDKILSKERVFNLLRL